MKRSFQFILFLIIVILSACNDDVRYDYGNFRIDFVTVLSPEEGIRFLRDDGIILLSETANDADNKYLVTGKRILLRYIPGEQISQTELSAKIQSMTFIPEGDITFVSQKEQTESFGNDPLYIISLWPGGGYLNLRYKIEQNNDKHQFALLYIQENQISPDTIFLELRHKADSDNPGYLSKGYAAFSLQKIQDKIPEAKAIKVNANVSNLKKQYFIFNTQTL